MSKIVKEDCRTISIYKLRQWGSLGGYYNGMIRWTSGWNDTENSIGYEVSVLSNKEMCMKVRYTLTDSWSGKKHQIDHKYPIVSTSCNFGGKRYWFECSVFKNGRYCGRRVAKLYLGSGSLYFACRHCYNLTYRSRIDGWTYSLRDLEELEEKIKRWYYRGKPTRKHMRYLRMDQSIDNSWIRAFTRIKNLNNESK